MTYLYENLPVQTKMTMMVGKADSSGCIIVGHFKYCCIRQINLRPNMQFFSTQQWCLSVIFEYIRVYLFVQVNSINVIDISLKNP